MMAKITILKKYRSSNIISKPYMFDTGTHFIHSLFSDSLESDS